MAWKSRHRWGSLLLALGALACIRVAQLPAGTAAAASASPAAHFVGARPTQEAQGSNETRNPPIPQTKTEDFHLSRERYERAVACQLTAGGGADAAGAAGNQRYPSPDLTRTRVLRWQSPCGCHRVIPVSCVAAGWFGPVRAGPTAGS
jgi:hypothetical protein